MKRAVIATIAALAALALPATASAIEISAFPHLYPPGAEGCGGDPGLAYEWGGHPIPPPPSASSPERGVLVTRYSIEWPPGEGMTVLAHAFRPATENAIFGGVEAFTRVAPMNKPTAETPGYAFSTVELGLRGLPPGTYRDVVRSEPGACWGAWQFAGELPVE